jgi:nitrate reductase (cytochrome)
LAFYGSGQWTIGEGYAANKFMKAGLGTTTSTATAAVHVVGRHRLSLATYGVDEPAGCYDDLDACDVLILWGNNPAEMHPVLFSRVIDRRAGREGAADRHRHAPHALHRHCQHYLEFKPHTDLAIANGIAHLLMPRRKRTTRSSSPKHCNFRQLDPDQPTQTCTAGR